MNTDDWPKISRKSNMSFQKEVGQNLKNKQTNKQTNKKQIKYLGTEAGLGEEVVNVEKMQIIVNPFRSMIVENSGIA